MTQSVMFHRVNSAPSKSLFERMSDLERNSRSSLATTSSTEPGNGCHSCDGCDERTRFYPLSLLSLCEGSLMSSDSFIFHRGEGQMSWLENKRKKLENPARQQPTSVRSHYLSRRYLEQHWGAYILTDLQSDVIIRCRRWLASFVWSRRK
jgi:hypothetical protein